MAYSLWQDVISVIGTKRVSVGTGTCTITSDAIGTLILKADYYIDGKLNSIYGTNGFGTSANGTRGVPNLVKSISEDLGAWYVIDSLTVPLESNLVDYGKRLKDRAMELLNQVVAGEIILTGYAPTDATAIPTSSDFTFAIYDEIVTLSGTKLTDLDWQKVIPFSEKVMGTALDGTRTYTRDTDYKIYYWNDTDSGTNYGKIRRLATGSITDGQDIKIHYDVYKDNVFGIRDLRASGRIDSGLGQGQSLP